MTNRDRNAYRVQLGQMSTRQIEEAEAEILATLRAPAPAWVGQDQIDEMWEQIDLIRDELAGRVTGGI
jgi:hypothetical protein